MKLEHVKRLIPIFLAIALILSCQYASAQVRIVGAISGHVTDPTGASVPGAKIVLRDEGTGIRKEAEATAEGTFLFPDLAHGEYELTVSSTGFQSAIVNHISVGASQTTDVPVTLRLGQQTESITVEGVAPVLEATSQLVNSTATTKLVNELPNSSRDGFTFARLVPGINGASGTRINNVPGGAINVTVDGINDASNGYKSGGTSWYATVPVRLGALEEVTVESGGLGADSGAESGVNIKFITKRGTSQYHGSGTYQPQSEQFNANSWSRNAQGLGFRTYSRSHTFAGNIGGPLVPFGYLKNKLFIFFNYEYVWNPATNSVTTSVMTPEAQQGIYKYIVNGTTNQIAQVNVLTLAAAQGYSTKLDPVSQSILALNNKIPGSARQVPTSDLNNTSWTWTQPATTWQYYPSTRFDYYITPKQQFTFSWNYFHGWNPGVPRFPMADSKYTGPYRQGWFVWSAALQSSISATTFNEFRYGVQHSGDSNASATANYGTYNTYNGVPLRIGGNLLFTALTPYIDQANVTGRHYITTMYDTLTKIHGNHTITAGGNFRSTDWHDTGETFPIPTYGLGAPSGDPMTGLAFTTATLPGDVSTDLGNPAALYNTLVGRVASTRLGTVVDPATKQYGGFINHTWTRSYMGGLYAQDRWRLTPDLTLNFGLRYEAQGDMYDVLGITAIPDAKSVFGPSVSLFTPGKLSGNNDPTATIGHHPYPPDWLNFAPNVGISWNPKASSGLLGKFLGGSKTVFRGSYGITYYDEGTQMFAQNMGTNTGKSASQTIQGGTSSFLPQFTTLSDVVANPVSLSAFTAIPAYSPALHQTTQTFAGGFSGMKPTLVAPYVINWSIGIQREIAKATVLEVRYVGNQGHRQWRTYNLNEVNIFENGFLKEFQNAQSNLAINAANGKGNTFQNLGYAGQVNLPIFDAAFGPRGTVTAIAASSGYQSTGFITNLQNGAAGSLASSLVGQNYFCRMMGSDFAPCLRSGIAPTGQSYNATGAGYPINFFALNPYAGGTLSYVDDAGWNDYNGMQVQLRKAFSHGVTWTANYTWSHGLTNSPADNANMGSDWVTLRNTSLSRRPSLFDIRHVFSTFGTYDLPIGKGKKLAINNRLLDALIGGWTASSTLTFNTGAPVQLGGNFNTFNNQTSGVVLAPGVTLDEISAMFHGQPLVKYNQTGNSDGRLNRAGATDTSRIAVPLDLIGSDGRANPKYLTWNTTPGQLGQMLFLYGKNAFNWNAAMTKTFRVTERMKFQLFGSSNNILNHPTWGMGSASLYSTSFGTVGSPSGSRTMTFRGILIF